MGILDGLPVHVEDAEGAVIVPAGAGDAALGEKIGDDFVPFVAQLFVDEYGVAAEFAAVDRSVALAAELGVLVKVAHDSFQSACLRIVFPAVQFGFGGIFGEGRHFIGIIGEGDADDSLHIAPRRALMGKGMRIVEMESVDDLVVLKIGEGLHGSGAVPVRAAGDEVMGFIDGADELEHAVDDFVPDWHVDAVRLVHDFKDELREFVLIARGDLRPDGIQDFFHIHARKGTGVSGVVEVENQIKVCFIGPLGAVVQDAQNFFGNQIAVFLFADFFKMDRKAYNVAAKGENVQKILLSKAVFVNFFGGAVFQPVGEVYALGKRGGDNFVMRHG